MKTEILSYHHFIVTCRYNNASATLGQNREPYSYTLKVRRIEDEEVVDYESTLRIALELVIPDWSEI